MDIEMNGELHPYVLDGYTTPSKIYFDCPFSFSELYIDSDGSVKMKLGGVSIEDVIDVGNFTPRHSTTSSIERLVGKKLNVVFRAGFSIFTN